MDDLPGIDDIASGYDAAKMISASEQNSKYRIFDLSDISATPFKVKILGKSRVYNKPALVQTVDVSVRRHATCESISSTFESFYRSYYQSTSFGAGVSVPGVVSLSVQYSETLKKIQREMTKHEKTVATSRIWWGQYSIQIAPPFLMKLDPMFTQSIDLLASEAPNPSNDDEQAYYNQFVQTFGTHYVSRAIVGGIAYMFTLIDSKFYNQSSYREVSRQVSLAFTVYYVNPSLSSSSGTSTEHVTETFKKNTEMQSVFQPPVASQESKSDVEVWLQTAGEQPVVVNRTLFPIESLIRNKPTVREHLRKTINFYMTHGVMPTLAQLNGRSTGRHALLPPKPIGPINGLDVVGCGFNILSMENKFCIFDQSNFTDNEQWSDPNNRSLTYSIPNDWFAVNTLESLTIDSAMVVTSVSDYFRFSRAVTVSTLDGVLGIGQRHTETTITDLYRRLYQEYYNLVVRVKQIGWYTLSVSTFPYPKLNPTAQQEFDRLPNSFDVQDLKIWKSFFKTFGTHVITSSNMGGQVWAETWFEKCLSSDHSETWIDEQIAASWFNSGLPLTSSEQYKLKVDQFFKNHSIFVGHLIGGTDQSMDPSEWDQWVLKIKARPRPISYRLVSLDQILPTSDKRNALKEAIEYVLNEAKQDDSTYINKLKSQQGQQKKRCS